MESIEIKFKLPKSILTVMGKTEKDVEQSLREAIAIDLYPVIRFHSGSSK